MTVNKFQLIAKLAVFSRLILSNSRVLMRKNKLKPLVFVQFMHNMDVFRFQFEVVHTDSHLTNSTEYGRNITSEPK